MSQDPGGAPAKHPPTPMAAGPRIGSIRRGLAVAIGFGPRLGAGASHVDPGTLLAVERSYLAADRTLMAWIRTALSIIGFGFTLGKLGQTVVQVELKGGLRGERMVSVESVAYSLVILGTGALAAALLQYLVSIAEYAELGLRHRVSITFLVGAVLVAMGAFAFTSLVVQL